jgi:hypothetical protein
METHNFTLFEQGPIERTGDRMHVTIDQRCRIFFNKIAIEAIGRPDGVALMYDERQKAIGVLPSKLGRQETFRLKSIDRTSGGKLISALNFCRHFSITAPGETLAFQNPRLNHDGVLILSLHHVQPVTRFWAKSKKN